MYHIIKQDDRNQCILYETITKAHVKSLMWTVERSHCDKGKKDLCDDKKDKAMSNDNSPESD